MQWSRVVMNLRLGRRANAATRIVEKDNQLFALDGIHGHHRDIASTDRGGIAAAMCRFVADAASDWSLS